MNEQIVTRRGEILDIKMLKSAHGNAVIFDRSCEVRDEKAPHVVRFNSGQATLLTMVGRPHYCLKCKNVE